jgi:excisionase family DNA binding protein
VSRSQFRYNRICQHCKKPFEAQKVTTAYCGHKCNQAAYKVRARLATIAAAEEAALKDAPALQTPKHILEGLKHREYLSVQEAGLLLGCSKQTIYRLIEAGRLRAANLGTRKTTIARAALESLFA